MTKIQLQNIVKNMRELGITYLKDKDIEINLESEKKVKSNENDQFDNNVEVPVKRMSDESEQEYAARLKKLDEEEELAALLWSTNA